jgi:hypothetical protein
MMIEDNDNDLRALREFRGALDEPPEGVLVKGRYRLASTDHRPPRRRRQWVLASAGAAAAVAVVVGAAAVAGGGGPGGQAGADRPSAGPSTSQGRGDKDIPVAPGTRAPAGAAITTDGGATHAKAIAAMDRLAGTAAGVQPLQIGDGQVLYVKSYNLVKGPGSYVHEVWQDQRTAVALRIRRTEQGTALDDSLSQAEIDTAAAEPASLYRPTPAYLASLPTDPAQLLEAWRQWSRETYQGREPDGMIWKEVFELLHYSEPFWSPQTRAAIYRALAKMPDVKATTATIDGRKYDLFCMIRPDAGAGASAECELFDSATGRFAGDAGPAQDLKLTHENVTLVDFGIQPRPAPADKAAAGSKPGGGGVVPSSKLTQTK